MSIRSEKFKNGTKLYAATHLQTMIIPTIDLFLRVTKQSCYNVIKS